MTRTPVAPTVISRAGVAPVSFASSDPANGNSVANDGGTWLEVSNTDSSARTVTVTPSRTVDGYPVTATAHSVAAGAQLRLGPFPVADYGAILAVDCSNALLKIAAYRLAG